MNNARFFSFALTFNYDMLLENVWTNYKRQHFAYKTLGFFEKNELKDEVLSYIKLHGSADNATSIVTPTWRKTFDNDNDNKWNVAGEILSKANHIRIIGYSLPVTDSYLKYFLKWGAAHEQNLKSIDVICLDDDQHSVENRYREFIHHKLNFYNKSTGGYLEEIKNGIENAHQNLFQKPQSS